MRILHTSDWHLGRSFHGTSLLSEQALAIDRIVALVTEHSVELVVIAGDLYDRAIAPAEAIALFDHALVQLRQAGAQVVAISGNHDSSVRVGVYDQVMSSLGVTVRGDIARSNEPVMVSSADGGPDTAVYLLPYLEPSLAGPLLAEPSDDPVGRLRHDEVTRLATDRIRADLATRGEARSVIVAHTFVTGSTTSESERDLTVGNVETVDRAAFDGVDYVALGHIHRSQDCGDARIAYSGTPLPYSFSEQDHVKSVRIVDMAIDGTVSVDIVALDVGLGLCTITGDLDNLLTSDKYAHAIDKRVRVHLTDRRLPMQAMPQLRKRFPHVAELQHLPDIGDAVAMADGQGPVNPKASPLQLTTQFWADQHGHDVDDAEAGLLNQALQLAIGGDAE